MIKKIQVLCILFIIILFASCKKNSTEHVPTLAELHNFNPQLLAEAVAEARIDGGIKSLIINRDGETIVEEYFNDHSDSVYHVRSVTKSFMSALYGIAIDQGLLTIEETIGDYLSIDYTLSPEVAGITIENLLTMSGGFEWEEFVNFNTYFNPWVQSDNLVQYALNTNIIHSQGDVFTYTTAGSQILSAIFEKATGRSLLDFAEEYLFTPMGMSDQIIWYTDFQEVVYGGMMLNVTANDMLKFGQLYLNKGMYNGVRIVSEEWVATSHYPHINTNSSWYGKQYGYQWWVDAYRSKPYYFANGYGGQFIFVFPDYDLVVVARSDSYLADPNRSRNDQWGRTSSIIVNKIFGALIN